MNRRKHLRIFVAIIVLMALALFGMRQIVPAYAGARGPQPRGTQPSGTTTLDPASAGPTRPNGTTLSMNQFNNLTNPNDWSADSPKWRERPAQTAAEAQMNPLGLSSTIQPGTTVTTDSTCAQPPDQAITDHASLSDADLAKYGLEPRPQPNQYEKPGAYESALAAWTTGVRSVSARSCSFMTTNTVASTWSTPNPKSPNVYYDGYAEYDTSRMDGARAA